MILRSRPRLRDYKNYIRPQRGFNKDIVNEQLEKAKHFSDNEKNFVMLKDTGNLIGYIDF